jgi:hypothetical protein
MENRTATPADRANSDVARSGGDPAPAPAAPSAGHITLTFSLQEAEALNRWMLKPSHDGAFAGDDADVRPAAMKLRGAVEYVQAIAAVRHELEQAGVVTKHLSDQQVAQLGRRISQTAPALSGAQG